MGNGNRAHQTCGVVWICNGGREIGDKGVVVTRAVCERVDGLGADQSRWLGRGSKWNLAARPSAARILGYPRP